MITGWKVGDKVVVKDPNFPARYCTVTKVGRRLITAGGQTFRALDTYPCRSTGKYNDTSLYRVYDWEFLQARERIVMATYRLATQVRAVHDPRKFIALAQEGLIDIQVEVAALAHWIPPTEEKT